MGFFDKIETGYTYDDLLLVPAYSEIESRSTVDISSEIVDGLKFDIPIISANMNSVTESKMVSTMIKLGATGAIHRFLDLKYFEHQINKISKKENNKGKFGISLPIKIEVIDSFLDRAKDVVGYIIIDIAHGHHKFMEKAIKHIKKNYPTVKIVAGNICTQQGAIDLINWGAEVLKVGIGGGCFTSDTLIMTKSGYKKIIDIKIGEEVVTHRGRLKKVIATTQRKEKEKLYNINGNKCTNNHEFYVLNKKYAKIVSDENLEEYAEWIPAEKLNNDYLLLKLKN